jgi:hypothetical protein
MTARGEAHEASRIKTAATYNEEIGVKCVFMVEEFKFSWLSRGNKSDAKIDFIPDEILNQSEPIHV